ncbi:lipid asymmetry maintenance protein MlaB [Paraglaciecola sp. L3A3]|uniref:STAS domain-containing protein n=1 Tax=Paraglaciecola sp. L3A3 TaxID=2686358 RepID=UPI00131D0739|nr:STAS domain-containing protein [Paraglaciecola sp. L3A3]
MKALTVVEQGSGYFALQGDLNRNTVPAFQQSLQELVLFSQASPKEIATLDMSGIEHTDTAGLAWLINLLKDCNQKNIKFVIKDIPETLVNLAKISDVDSFLSVQ